LRTDLTGICAVSWGHDGAPVGLQRIRTSGLVIAFSADVLIEDVVNAQAVKLFVPQAVQPAAGGPVLIVWCQYPVVLQPFKLATRCVATAENLKPLPIPNPPNPAALCDAVELSVNIVQFAATFSEQKLLPAADYIARVQVHGDLIRDAQGNAVDGNHLPPWVGMPGFTKTGDQIQGGLFESWFTLSANG
jgi:hypothetical protein